MGIRPKPKPANVGEFIHGATADKVQRERAEVPLKLRLPPELLAQVDEAVAARRPSPSRHQWLLEAIYEKLARGRDANQSPTS